MPNQDTTGILWALHQSRVSFPGHNLPSFAVSAWTFSGPLSWRKGHHYEETKASYPFMKSYISILWAIVCSWSIKIMQHAASISRHVYIIYLIKIEIDLDVIIYIQLAWSCGCSWHQGLACMQGTSKWDRILFIDRYTLLASEPVLFMGWAGGQRLKIWGH